MPLIDIPSPRTLEDIDSSSLPRDANFRILTVPATLTQAHEQTVLLVHAEDASGVLNTYPRPSAAPGRPPLPYRVADAGESGLGVFATADIQQGEVIICERPLLVYPMLLPYRRSAVPGHEYPELGDALDQMSLQNRDSFRHLANCHPSEPSVAKGIIDTNSLDLGTLPHGSAHQYGAVCRDISRINHSCSPNAVYRFDPEAFAFEARALSHIDPGSEIFISYVDPALPRAQRQDALSDYGFACTCEFACGLTGPALARSEFRRGLIAHADADAAARDAALERWARGDANAQSTPDELVTRVDRMYMGLFEAERLYYEAVWEGFAVRLCKASCAVGDLDGARRWAGLAAGLNRAYVGNDRGWDAVAAAPQCTEWWNRRRLA